MTDVLFLASDCVCDYDWVPSSKGVMVKNALTMDHGQEVFFGRLFNYTLYIGKVGTTQKTIFYSDEGLEKVFSVYEVLVCNPKPCLDTNIDLTNKPTDKNRHKISKCEVVGGGETVYCRNFTTLNKACEITTNHSIVKIRQVFDLLTTGAVSPKQLIFRQQVVEILPINLHAAFPLLRSIEVSRSGLLNIAQTYFDGLQDLQTLNLTGNLIDDIEIGFFTRQEHLTMLDLSFNRIQSIKTKSFEGLKKLEYLYLNDNHIKEVTTDFLSCFKVLKLLDFARNNSTIPSFPENSLKKVRNEIITTCPAQFELSCAFYNNQRYAVPQTS